MLLSVKVAFYATGRAGLRSYCPFRQMLGCRFACRRVVPLSQRQLLWPHLLLGWGRLCILYSGVRPTLLHILAGFGVLMSGSPSSGSLVLSSSVSDELLRLMWPQAFVNMIAPSRLAHCPISHAASELSFEPQIGSSRGFRR